ncbi:MAG: carbon monoxide dehydrogenase subunit G [Dehalococcoidia bacterium]|nr:carbon monoxide dehydrogenase subunit G [Dehalococcoidia bacterium]
MQIAGQYRLGARREEAWELLLAPDALQRALPGCQRLVASGEDRYDITLKVGVAAIKGTITGTVAIANLERPSSYTMAVDGKGSIGVAAGKATIQLAEDGEATLVTVAGNAEIHGLVASVGQRMLRGVAGRMMDQFFKSIDKQLRERQPRRAAGAVVQGDAR